MKLFKLNILIPNLLVLLVLTGCEEGFVRKISKHNSGESHNTGQDCISCHTQGGQGEFEFGVAGSVYKQDGSAIYPNTTINLYTSVHGTGKLKYTIEADALGNFYTTKNIHFGQGLFPSITGNGVTKYMMDPITTGACNSCHGVTTDVLWTY